MFGFVSSDQQARDGEVVLGSSARRHLDQFMAKAFEIATHVINSIDRTSMDRLIATIDSQQLIFGAQIAGLISNCLGQETVEALRANLQSHVGALAASAPELLSSRSRLPDEREVAQGMT